MKSASQKKSCEELKEIQNDKCKKCEKHIADFSNEFYNDVKAFTQRKEVKQIGCAAIWDCLCASIIEALHKAKVEYARGKKGLTG